MATKKVGTGDASSVEVFNEMMATLSGTLAERSRTGGLPTFFPGGITGIDFELNAPDGVVKLKITGPDAKQEPFTVEDAYGILGVGPGCEPISSGDKNFIAGIVFGETSVVRAPNSQAAMAEARQWIAEIAYRRQAYPNYGNFPNGLATSQKPKEPISDVNIRKRWEACQKAQIDGNASFKAKQQAGKDKKALHYFMWTSDDGKAPRTRRPTDPPADAWPYQCADKIAYAFGPFTVDNVGSTPKGDDIYIFVYDGVP